jgi:hypothetical protein
MPTGHYQKIRAVPIPLQMVGPGLIAGSAFAMDAASDLSAHHVIDTHGLKTP